MTLALAVAATLARHCAPQVAVPTMLALVMNESRLDPFAIGDNSTGRSYHAQSPTGAIRQANALIAAGHSVDMGLAQINSRTAPAVGLDVAGAFDPCRNLAAAARLMVSNYRRVAPHAPSDQHAIATSLSLYNTGSVTRGFANGYVGRVWRAAASLGPERPTPFRLPYDLADFATESAPRSPRPPAEAPWSGFGNPANVMVFVAAETGRASERLTANSKRIGMHTRLSLTRSPAFWTLALVTAALVAGPAHAAGTADIQTFVDNIKSWLTGTIAKSVSVIAVAVCGYRFFTGRASAGPLIAVLGGIMLIFGASWVLDQITGGGS